MKHVAEDIAKRADGREIAIFGCGFYGRCMLELFSCLDVEIKYFIDRKHLLFGHVNGRKVYPKSFLNPDDHKGDVFYQ